MANAIEEIPEKTRWEMATKGLTGAYIAISNALKQALAVIFHKFLDPVGIGPQESRFEAKTS